MNSYLEKHKLKKRRKNKEKKWGTCALCKKNNVQIQKSHIIPNFVLRKMKSNEQVGFLKDIYNIDNILEKNKKKFLLCKNCEQNFCKVETKFANIIFYPFFEDNYKHYEYEVWINKFILSITWRIIHSYFDKRNKNMNIYKILREIEPDLRNYLFEDTQLSTPVFNGMFYYDDIEFKYCKKNIDTKSFFDKIVFSKVFEREKGIYFIINLCGIIIYTFIPKSSFNIQKYNKVNRKKLIKRHYKKFNIYREEVIQIIEDLYIETKDIYIINSDKGLTFDLEIASI